MMFLRKAVKWIGTHRLLSSLVSATLVVVVAFIWIHTVRSEGTVSDAIKRGTIIQSVYGIGTVMANKIYRISPGVTQTITALYVQEGDTVKSGAPLLKIDGTTYKAPFDGTVTACTDKTGDNIFANVPVLIMVDLLDRYVVVSLEQQGALRILQGQKAKLSFDTMRASNFEGVVKSIYSNATNFLARIDIPNFPPKILPGMTADVSITIATHDNALLIPVAALEGGKSVWVNQFLPKKLEVKVGIVDKAFAEVLSSDLKEGERLLIRKQAGP